MPEQPQKEEMNEVLTVETTHAASVYEIRVLGPFDVLRNGEHVDLTTSRKTRALLAYLATAKSPQQRKHLCEMFWDSADNPRRALRWSLSIIRQIVHIEGHRALVTERDTIALCVQFIAVDFWRISALINDLASVETSELEQAAGMFRGQFLDDLSLPRCPEFEGWRISCMNDVRLSKAQILRRLIERFERDAPRALPYARTLHAMYPEDATVTALQEIVSERARASKGGGT